MYALNLNSELRLGFVGLDHQLNPANEENRDHDRGEALHIFAENEGLENDPIRESPGVQGPGSSATAPPFARAPLGVDARNAPSVIFFKSCSESSDSDYRRKKTTRRPVGCDKSNSE
jgi:hypothetical protein